MKKIIFLLVLAMPFLFAQGFSTAILNGPDDICGVYWSPKKNAKIEIFKKANQYFGKSIWVIKPRKDTKNPNEKLQKRDILGIEILSHFTYKDGMYTDGKIYDPENGKTYDCNIKIDGKNLKVRGYIGFSLIGRTEIFERISAQ